MPEPCSVEVQFFRMLNRLVEPKIRAGWASPRFVPGGLIVLETTGRRTGRRSRVPLAAIRIDGHVLVSTFRGHRSEWVRNLSAHPDVRYWLRGRPRQALALVISTRHRERGREELPAAVRWLVRLLVPYTYAGWAFAVLAPDLRSATKTSAHQRLVRAVPGGSSQHATPPRSGIGGSTRTTTVLAAKSPRRWRRLEAIITTNPIR
jgi:deazaflavin-dependent oxidoreductase (nitroreductase family)